MSDPRTVVLQEALEVYNEAVFMPYKVKIQRLRKLDMKGLFSTTQLARIGRIADSSARNEELGRGVTGGRFHPAALSSLLILRKQVIMNTGISETLLRTARSSGCSLTVVARLVGMPSSTAYYHYERG